jgi:hypothetical protein
MLFTKIPTWEQLNENKSKLQTLDSLTEHGVWTIWRSSDDDEVEFKDGKALIIYDYNIPLAEKMIFRRRMSPDMCFFWNSIDPINRRVLLRSVGLLNKLEDLDFFVWLGNYHGGMIYGHLPRTTVQTYFATDEETQKKWLLEFAASVTRFM